MQNLTTVTFSDDNVIRNSLGKIQKELNTLNISENGIITYIKKDDYLTIAADIFSAEKNLESGLKMFGFKDLKPSHLSTEIFDEISDVNIILKEKRLAVIKTLLNKISENDRSYEFYYLGELAKLHGFYDEMQFDENYVSSVSGVVSLKQSDSLYAKGVRYYIAAREIIEKPGKKRLPKPYKYGLIYDHPFVVLARREYDIEKKCRGFTLDIIQNQSYWIDGHTKMRIAFRHAVAQYFYTGKWTDDILAGFKTGLKRDSDLAVAAIINAVKKTFKPADYSVACKIAAAYGYRAAAYAALFTHENQNLSLDRQDLFELFICAQDSDEYTYRYFKAHDNLTGRETGLLNADISLSSRLEIFHRIKDDPAALEPALNEARQLWDIKAHKDSKIAIWIGTHYFNKREYKTAFDFFYKAYRIFKSIDLAWEVAQCYLHGYGVDENYDEANKYISLCNSAEGQASGALFRVYGIGSPLNPKEPLSKNNAMYDAKTAKIVDAFIAAAKINIRSKNFWREFWDWHDNYCGLTFININQKKAHFRPFIEFCNLAYIIMLNGEKKIDIYDFFQTLEFLKSEDSAFSTVLNKQLSDQYKFFDKKLLLKKPFMAHFNKNSRHRFYNKIAREIDKRLNLILANLQDIYNGYDNQEKPDKFTDKNYIPWMDELEKTLDGRKLYNEAKKADYWTSRKIYSASAENGDANAALWMFGSKDYVKKDVAALKFLDIAVQCNEPRALIENAYLKEHGVIDGDNLFEDYRKAIIKGNSAAMANASVYYKNISPSFIKARKIRRLIELNDI